MKPDSPIMGWDDLLVIVISLRTHARSGLASRKKLYCSQYT